MMQSKVIQKIVAILLMIAFIILYQVGPGLVGIFVVVNESLGIPELTIIQIVLTAVIMLAVSGFHLWFAHFKKWYAGFKNSFNVWTLIYLSAGYAGMFSVSLIGSLLLGGGTTANQEVVVEMMSIIPMPLYFIMIVIAAPICEEVIFRGFVFKEICKENIYLAYAFSIFTFALLHMPTNLGSWIVYGGMGLVLSIVFHLSKSLEVAIGLHLLNNLIAFTMMVISTQLI